MASPSQVGSWAMSAVHCVMARTKTRSKNSSSGLTCSPSRSTALSREAPRWVLTARSPSTWGSSQSLRNAPRGSSRCGEPREVGQALVARREGRGVAPGRPCPSAAGARTGRAPPRASASTRATASGSRVHVKCSATVGLAVLRAHPQLVGGDRADLADLEHGARGSRRGRGRRGSPPSACGRAHVVLGLDLLAVAGREAHAEVRQAVRPRARDAELRRAVDGIEAQDRVAVDRRRDRAEELVALLLGRVGRRGS